MKSPAKPSRTTQAFEAAIATQPPVKCLLRLYVAGATARSHQAILRARELCATEFDGNCELEVIDVHQQPILAREGQIVATPTLVKVLPRPVRRFIGDLANTSGFVGPGAPDPTKPKLKR
jgi:circadian clock protein KaiB